MVNVDLYNGDCLEVMQSLISDGVKVDMVLTDPPYGTTACKWDSVIPFDEMWDKINQLINPTTPVVLFGSEPFMSQLINSNLSDFKYIWVWEKDKTPSFGIAKYQPMRYHELIAVFYKKAGQFYKQMIPRTSPRIKQAQKNNYDFKTGHHEGIMVGAKNIKNPSSKFDPNFKNPSSVLHFNIVTSNSKEKVAHPTQKPVKLLEYLIKTYTNEGGAVLDFTMGSGSTGVACVETNRNFIGIELDKDYFKIAETRIKEAQIQTKLI